MDAFCTFALAVRNVPPRSQASCAELVIASRLCKSGWVRNRRNFLKAYHSNLLREKVYENSRVEHYGSLPSALEAWQQRAGDFSLQFFSSRTLWKRMKFCGVPALEIGMPDLV